MMKIKAYITAPPIHKRAIQAAVEAFAVCVSSTHGHPKGWGVNVVLADNATVHRLNKAYRGKDKPTNVLSFHTDPADPTLVLQPYYPLGDIIIAHEVVHDESLATGIPFQHHLQHLTVHGLLHLLGYDHELGDAEADLMEKVEIFILNKLDIPNPYDQ